ELGVLLEEPLLIDVDQRAVQVEEQGSRRVPAGDGRLQQEEHLRGCPYEARISIIPVRPKVVRAPGSRLERQADVWAGGSVSSFPVGTGSVADGMGSTPDRDRLPALGRGPLVYGAGSLTGHHLLALSSQRKLLKHENAKTARPSESTRGRRPSACSRILVKPPPCLRVGGRPSQALSCRRGTPNGIRTRATALKGRRPRPLDDGGTRPVSGPATALHSILPVRGRQPRSLLSSDGFGAGVPGIGPGRPRARPMADLEACCRRVPVRRLRTDRSRGAG